MIKNCKLIIKTILEFCEECSSYYEEYTMTMSDLVEATKLSKKEIKEARQYMAKAEMMDFIKGLTYEESDGYYGSGYFLTEKGYNWYNEKKGESDENS